MKLEKIFCSKRCISIKLALRCTLVRSELYSSIHLHCMITHKTKGIVLRTVKYGETSVIANVYTELFGIQSYIVKGVRQSSKHGATKGNYFQPAAILEMEVYHNELKNLQFIKEYQWSYLYEHVLFNVV